MKNLFILIKCTFVSKACYVIRRYNKKKNNKVTFTQLSTESQYKKKIFKRLKCVYFYYMKYANIYI